MPPPHTHTHSATLLLLLLYTAASNQPRVFTKPTQTGPAALAEIMTAKVADGRAQAIFVYGTLRPDFSPSEDKWGVTANSSCYWVDGTLCGYRLLQSSALDYPFIHTCPGPSITHYVSIIYWSICLRCQMVQHLDSRCKKSCRGPNQTTSRIQHTEV